MHIPTKILLGFGCGMLAAACGDDDTATRELYADSSARSADAGLSDGAIANEAAVEDGESANEMTDIGADEPSEGEADAEPSDRQDGGPSEQEPEDEPSDRQDGGPSEQEPQDEPPDAGQDSGPSEQEPGEEPSDAGRDDAAFETDPDAAEHSVCGDGVIAGEEVCDDGAESAACDDDCTPAICGDGVVNGLAGEECDDEGDSQTCDLDCTPAVCGDGALNSVAGEACDDGNNDNEDGCSATCAIETCGDGLVQAAAGETCDEQGESPHCDPDCTAVECGDGFVNQLAGEVCDDGDNGACPCGCDVLAVDTDADGVVDCLDACPGYPDGDDEDGDGIPDACDLDCAPSDQELREQPRAACAYPAGAVDSMGNALECASLLDDDNRTGVSFAYTGESPWLRFDLGTSVEVDRLGYVTDWWTVAPEQFRVYVSDDPSLTPGAGATLVHDGTGNRPPNGSAGNFEEQVHALAASTTGRYWYFEVLSSYQASTAAVALREFRFYDYECEDRCGRDTDDDGINDCFDPDALP